MLCVKNAKNLFVTDWMELLELWHLHINTYCKNVIGQATRFSLKIMKIENKFPGVLSENLGRCYKAKRNFKGIKGSTAVFKPKCSLQLVAFDKVNEELDSLEKIGVIEKFYHSKWATLAVYLKTK